MQGTTGKVVLVVLGVMLMLVFILPSGLTRGGGSDAVVGTLRGEKVKQSDVREAGALLGYAASRLQVSGPQGQGGSIVTGVFGPALAETLSRDPELFYLLLTEARRDGLRSTPADVSALLTSNNVSVLVADPSDPTGKKSTSTPFASIPGEQVRQNAIAAAAAVLDVRQSAARYADFYKVSRPVLDYHLATENQRVGLTTVVFDARDYLADVPEPDDAAVTAQFEAYKNVAPGGVAALSDDPKAAENPFAFGYRLPARVKVQYLTIPADAVDGRVRSELAKTELAERESTLYRYWSDNQALFPVPPGAPETRPSSQPTTEPVDVVDTPEPTTGPAAGESLLASENPAVKQFLAEQTIKADGTPAQAAWRRFLSVHDVVARRYVSKQTADLEAKLTKRLRDRLTSDYRTLDAARSKGDAKAEQSAGVGAMEYLQKVAADLAGELGIRPAVASYGRNYLDAEQLSKTADVGPIAEAGIATGNPQSPGVSFAQYVFAATAPLVTDAQRSTLESRGLLLKLDQPSQTISDAAGNRYIFRVVDAKPAAAPADVAEAAERVRRDLRLKAGYDKAFADATAMAEAARADSLTAAAGRLDKRAHDVPPFVPGGQLPNPEAFGASDPTTRPAADDADGVDDAGLSFAARLALKDEIYKLLGERGESPVGVLQLRPAFRAVAAQLGEVAGAWTDDQSLATTRVQVRQQLAQSLAAGTPAGEVDPITAEFYDRARVLSRLGFVPTPGRAGDGG